jgi:hypothetical protein
MTRGTGVDKDIADLLDLGERLRRRIDQRIGYLKRLERSISTQNQFLVTWTLVLMILAWDVSESVLTLARSGNHVRAIHILSRSLFEYATRLEYYAYFPEDAVKYGTNLKDWLAKVVQKTSYRYDLDSMTPEQQASIGDLLTYEYDVLKPPQFIQMLQRVYEKRGYGPGEVAKLVGSQYNDFYSAASALSHGSEGSFPDVIYKDQGGYDARNKAVDTDSIVVLKNAIAFLLRLHYAFCRHYPQFDDEDLRNEFRERFDMNAEDILELE